MTFGQQMMLGGGRPNVTLSGTYSPSSTMTNPATATATFELQNDGDIAMSNGTNTVTDQGDWLAPKQGMSQYECRLTQNSGTALGGAALSTWLNLGTTRTWTLTRASDGTNNASATIEIGYAGLNTALKSATVNFTAIRESP